MSAKVSLKNQHKVPSNCVNEDRAKHCFKNELTLVVFIFCSTPKTSQCLKDTLELEISLISTTIQTRGILTTPGTKDTPAPMVAPGIAAM